MSETIDEKQPAIVITAANSFIGAYLSHAFLDQGWPVVGHYRTHNTAVDELRQRGATLVQGDFSDTQTSLDITRRLGDQAPAIRTLIHNASDFAPTRRHEPIQAGQQFQLFFEVHMRAPWLLNTKLAKHITGGADHPGDIIHITDIYADNPTSDYDIYCATKAGLQNLALAFAKQLAPAIKVNCIQPGPISFQDWVSLQQQQDILDATLLHRTGSAANIFQAISAIMGNDYQTGAIIPVDGGRRLQR